MKRIILLSVLLTLALMGAWAQGAGENESGKKEYRLLVHLEGAEAGKVVVMNFSSKGFSQDTVAFTDHRIDLNLPGKDTVSISLRIMCDELGAPAPRMGTYYPVVSLLSVPGEFAILNLKAEKGKESQVQWVEGGNISHDFIRLNYEQTQPAEVAYRQLVVDNIIRGGDIREYRSEYDAYAQANKQTIMEFIRANPTSYVSAMNLLDHYIWFDENEIEAIYNQFPAGLKGSAYGRVLGRKLEAGRAYRTGTMAAGFVKKDMEGRKVALEDYRGKYVLLDFWGSWCGPCRESHPHLKELHQKYGDRMVFINVANENVRDLAQARKLWQQAVKEDGMTWTQVLNNEGVRECNLLDLYHINSFPTKILIDPQGRIVARLVGSSADLGEQLEKIFGS